MPMNPTTPTLINTQCRIVRDYIERLRSHVQDGYAVRHETKMDTFYMVRLKHMSNGNEIVLKADFKNNSLSQKTNHIVTYYQVYE